jgi:hypothetical protein
MLSMQKSFLFFLFTFFAITLFAQEKFTISGYVKDSTSNENIIGATVSFKQLTKGVTTNQYGFFSITVPSGAYRVSVSHIGYETYSEDLQIQQNINMNYKLLPRVTQAKEIVINADKREANIKAAQMGRFDLSIAAIKNVPALAGEVDPLKVLQLLPGVRNAGEGSSGLYVRGGAADQNLILLDDAIVYNPGHLFGFFSVFNSDALKNVSLIKGGMPAQYGGRISSVLDISMKDGNSKKFQVEGGIGTIASRLTLQGPIIKEKASFMISARRTYIDMIIKPFIDPESNFSETGYYFYDLNAKVNYRFSDKDRLYLSGYFGRDVFNFKNKERGFSTRIPWGNSTATLRWNHVFNDRLFSNTSVVWNDYNFQFEGGQENFTVSFNSAVRDLTIKTDFDYYPLPGHQVKLGALYTRHQFNPQTTSGRSGDVEFAPAKVNLKYANQFSAYLQDDWEINEKFQVNLGLRYSFFQQTGPYTKYNRDANGNTIDSIVYDPGKVIQEYGGLEPRATVRYSINSTSSIKAGINRNMQFIHLVSNSGSTLPTDIWVPSTFRVKPQIGWQYSAGYFRNFKDNTWESSIEVYYKSMENQIEYKEGFTNGLGDPEESFVFGKGWSYGAEFYLNKSKGKFTGWIGYTLSWTWRSFPDLNGGKQFPARYDRRHDVSVVMNYQQNPKWKFSAVWVYATGNAFTLPERFFLVEGVLTQQYSSINQYTLPAYHRMDFSVTYVPKALKKRKFKSEWVFSAYNLYSRQNPYFIYYATTGSPLQGNLEVEARQVSLFPIIPAITYNFKF